MEFYEFNNKQIDRLSEYFANFSLLTMATLVLPNIFGIELRVWDLVIGSFISIMLLLGSLVLMRK